MKKSPTSAERSPINSKKSPMDSEKRLTDSENSSSKRDCGLRGVWVAGWMGLVEICIGV